MVKVSFVENSEVDNNLLWAGVIELLVEELGSAVYKSWLSKITFENYQNSIITLSAPTRFIRDWIATHYEKKILRAWKLSDSTVRKIVYQVKPANGSKASLTAVNQVAPKNADKSTVVASKQTSSFIEHVANKSEESDNFTHSKLDSRFTFENFVVGTPNQLAYAAARSVAESEKVKPGSNPLFLYGGVGLGKTHLMHSVAWYIKNHQPDRKVAYISAEKFMYEFIRSLRSKDIMSFKESFRSVDVLMVDDVQFMCGKESTQEEFFHTLNTLIDNNKQIIISCDRSPSDLEGMEERIKSRLGWGLVADIHNTTYELRLGILESKIAESNINVPKDVLEFLSAKITSNVRELEGALNKVIAHSSLIGKKINLEVTQEILRDLLRSNEKSVTVEQIQRKVAERYSIKVSDMSSGRRSRSVARPRQIAMYLSKQLTMKSLAEIGRKFGGKDHTTVMHAIKKIEQLLSEDKDFSEDIRLLERVLEC